MPAASHSYSFNHGLRVADHRSQVRIFSMPARQQGKTAFMSRLRDAIRSGALKSAWGDMDEPDSTGLNMRSGSVPSAAEIDDAARILDLKMRAERERAKAAQDELINKAIELQRQQAAERAQNELEELDGFGTF